MTGSAARRSITPDNPRGLRDLPFPVADVTAGDKRRARAILTALRDRYPDARCALTYSAPHELLIATILSAQTTDINVNKATPALFKRFPAPADYAAATPEMIEPSIRSLGFYHNKVRAIHESMREVMERFGGEIPRTMDDLLTLRGVARKTANVVLGNAFGINDGFVVDTHIERLAKRFGLAPADATVAKVERSLCALFPRDAWMELSHLFIAHGRAVCKARGGTCAEDAICRRFCSDAGIKPKRTPAPRKKSTRAPTPRKARSKRSNRA